LNWKTSPAGEHQTKPKTQSKRPNISGRFRVTPQFHAVDSQGSTFGGWILGIPGPLKGLKKMPTQQTVGHYLIFLGKKHM